MAEVEARCRYRPSRAWFALARRLLDGSLDPSCPVRLSSLAMTISRGPTSTPGCTIRAAGWCRKLRGLWRRPRRPNDGRVLRGLLASSCLEALFRPSGGAPSRRVGRGRACTPHAYAGTGLQFATGPSLLARTQPDTEMLVRDAGRAARGPCHSSTQFRRLCA